MKLLTKFNIVLLIFFGAGSLLIAQLAKNFLLENARNQVVQQAELMMAGAKATRDYTDNQIKPLLLKNPEHEVNFLPQTVPAFSAITVFGSIRKNYTDYSYREATLNPTNLADRAEDWEADLIRYFEDHPNDKQLVNERETPTGRQLYLAKPMRAGASCLECHSEPSVAPPAMIRKYGPNNGFGWGLNTGGGSTDRFRTDDGSQWDRGKGISQFGSVPDHCVRGDDTRARQRALPAGDSSAAHGIAGSRPYQPGRD